MKKRIISLAIYFIAILIMIYVGLVIAKMALPFIPKLGEMDLSSIYDIGRFVILTIAWMSYFALCYLFINLIQKIINKL